MGLWKKVQRELDRAGDAARGALDEGKIRIEIFRVRQQADKAAQALGYAIHRAQRDGKELEADVMTRLDGALAAVTAKRPYRRGSQRNAEGGVRTNPSVRAPHGFQITSASRSVQ